MIRQNMLFPFETLMQYEEPTRLSKVLQEIDLTPILKLVTGDPHRRGPKGYHIEAVVNAYIARLLYGIPTVAKLVERLKSDIRLRYDCGFPWNKAPSTATFSRVFQRLAKSELANRLFQHHVGLAKQAGLITGEAIAIDSTAIQAYEKPCSSKDKDSGTSASWGVKKDSDGKRKAWYGYKLHAATDALSGLPVACITTPAHMHDSTQAIPLVQRLTDYAKYLVLDGAYDTKEIYQFAWEHKMQALVPLNLRKETEPPVGFTQERIPLCSAGYPMTFWGYDAKRKELKYRCPHVCGTVDCLHGTAWCSGSNYGMVRKVRVEQDLRNFPAIPRTTKRWKQIYNLRTSVERLFSVIKEHLGANRPMVQGLAKVHTHLLLCCTTLIAATLAAQRDGKVRKKTAKRTA